jgi:hypothetical protein
LNIAERQNETMMKANPFKYPTEANYIDIDYNNVGAQISLDVGGG